MSVRPLRGVHLTLFLLVPLAVSAGCGDDTSEPPEPVSIAKAEVDSGDDQEGVGAFALPDPLRVVVTRNNGPAEDVPVVWSTGDGGELTPSISVTDEQGIAVTQWVLGPNDGPQTATASVEDGEGSPVTFTANAIVPEEPTTTTIEVLDNEFSPRDVIVRPNQTVTWVWREGAGAHNIVPVDGLLPEPSGPPVAAPKTFVYVFKTPGVYQYYCEVHGSPAGGMTGTITVLGTDN